MAAWLELAAASETVETILETVEAWEMWEATCEFKEAVETGRAKNRTAHAMSCIRGTITSRSTTVPCATDAAWTVA
jgi:hypothetical protein